MNALALAGQTLTAMGKGPAKEKPDRSEWVVRGRTSSIFQRSKMQKADAACWEPLHIAASVNNRWMCATTQLLQEQRISSAQLLPLAHIYMWKVPHRVRRNIVMFAEEANVLGTRRRWSSRKKRMSKVILKKECQLKIFPATDLEHGFQFLSVLSCKMDLTVLSQGRIPVKFLRPSVCKMISNNWNLNHSWSVIPKCSSFRSPEF